MKVLILSAGKGTRLRPLSLEKPKPLVPFINRAMINYNFELFEQFSYRDFIVNISYEKEKFNNFIPYLKNININYSIEKEILGTGGGIKKVKTLIKDDNLIVMNGDIFYDFNINKLNNEFKSLNSPLALLVVKKNPQGNITLNNNIITSIRNKKTKFFKENSEKYIFTGLHILSNELVNNIDEFCIVETYMKLLDSNRIFALIDNSDSFWTDLGTLNSFFESSLKVLKNKDKLKYLQKSIKKELINLSELKNIENSIIGKNTKINKNIFIRDSLIMDNVIYDKNKDLNNKFLY